MSNVPDVIPAAFASLPVAACYICQAMIYEYDDLAHEQVGDEILRRHRMPCYSAEVPV